MILQPSKLINTVLINFDNFVSSGAEEHHAVIYDKGTLNVFYEAASYYINEAKNLLNGNEYYNRKD